MGRFISKQWGSLKVEQIKEWWLKYAETPISKFDWVIGIIYYKKLNQIRNHESSKHYKLSRNNIGQKDN